MPILVDCLSRSILGPRLLILVVTMAYSRFFLFVAIAFAVVNSTILPQVNITNICDQRLLMSAPAGGIEIQDPKCSQSAGGKAVCSEGTIKVTASANNSIILLEAPANNSAATEMFVEFTQRGSNITTTANGGPRLVNGTFGIYAKFCIPSNTALASKVETVQVLTHGGTLDRTYWDFAPGYSYVDVAASAGYATFTYDRLGSGLSDHPDPTQLVQLNLQVEIAHILVQGLRSAAQYCGQPFKAVVGVGHSEGSGVVQNQITKYPKDYDAAILTGTSAFFDFAVLGVASTDMIIANTDQSGRFANLSNGYFTPAPIPQALQFAFYRYPNFEQKSKSLPPQTPIHLQNLIQIPAVFDQNLKTRQTNALGEMFTLGSAYTVAANFTGPLDVVNGENDYFYCGGDCTFPTDQTLAVKPTFFPAASKGSQTFLVKGAGHNVALHSDAALGYNQMIEFLKTNGIN